MSTIVIDKRTYEVVDLDRPNLVENQFGTEAVAVNDEGQCACNAFAKMTVQGLFSNPRRAYVGPHPGLDWSNKFSWSRGTGINNHGEVSGQGLPRNAAFARSHAFVDFKIIPSLDPSAWQLSDVAYGIDDEGVVILTSNRMRRLIWGPGMIPVETACTAVQDQESGIWSVVPVPGALEFPPWMHFTRPAKRFGGMVCGTGRYLVPNNNKLRGFVFSKFRQSVLPGALLNNKYDFEAVDMNDTVVVGNGVDEGNNITGVVSMPWWHNYKVEYGSSFLTEGLVRPKVIAVNAEGTCIGSCDAGPVVWPTYDAKPIVLSPVTPVPNQWSQFAFLGMSDAGHLCGKGWLGGDFHPRAVLFMPST